jgi:hypothetical protein
MVHPDRKENKLRGEGRGGTKEDDSKKALARLRRAYSEMLNALFYEKADL